MSRSNNHKIEGKFNNGLLQDIKNEIPINVVQKWNRRNFERGWFRFLRKKIKEDIADKEMDSQLTDSKLR